MKKEEAKKKYQAGEIQILFDDKAKKHLLDEFCPGNLGMKYYMVSSITGYEGKNLEHDKLPIVKISEIEEEVKQVEELNTPKHYDNSKGTLYKVAKERGWNPYLFDIVKRLEREDKKGEFDSDLEKSINVIKLWKEESKCQ